MSSEVNQTDLFKTRVYQFLSERGDWKTQADCIKQDGIITNAEFHAFLENGGFWNGEMAKDDDIVDQFWKTIDTQINGQIKRPRATRSDNGALNSKEIEKMQLKIDTYAKMNEYIANNVTAPSDLNFAQFKTSVAASLANSLEKDFIAKGCKLEDLDSFLEGLLPMAQKKTAANMYAQEFIKSLGNVVSKYGYKDDDVLQNIISCYVQKLDNGDSVEDMASVYTELKSGAENIVKAYLATAGIDENGNNTTLSERQKNLLADYNYNVDGSLPLNGLQEAVIRTEVKAQLDTAKANDADYSAYPDVYEAAIAKFLDEIVAGGAFKDFEKLKGYGFTEFIASNAYTTIKASAALEMTSEPASDMYTALSNTGLTTLADNIANSMKGEYPAWEKIKSDLLQKAADGEFGVGSAFDSDKFTQAAIDAILDNLMEGFYPNGFDKNMDLDELNKTYNTIATALTKNGGENSVSTFKKAAIAYCDVVYNRGKSLKEAVIDIFGEKYSDEINKLTSAEIRTKMARLQAKVEEIGDVSKFELDSISGIADSVKLDLNKTETYKLSASVTNPDSGETIDSSRITYKAVASGSGISVSIENGQLKVTTGNVEGTCSIKLTVLVDNIAIGEPKTITVTVESKKEINPNDLKGDIYSGQKVSDFYGQNKKVNIANWSKSGADSTAIASMTTILNSIKTSAINAGYNKSAAETAYQKALALYSAVCNEHVIPNSRGVGDYQTTYDGELYSYVSQSWRLESTNNSCDGNGGAETRTNHTNHLGIEFSESYAGANTYKVEVNLSCVIDIFNKFYKKAMGVS